MTYKISKKLAAMKPSAIREIFKSLSDPSIIAFAAGNPAPETFPAEQIARLSKDIFKNQSHTALQYGITEGYPKLREQLSDRLEEKLGISREANELIIVSGGQQGLELCCKAMCDEGDVVLCENPSFIGALNAFRSNGAVPIGVDMEDDGISISSLEETILKYPSAKLLYLIPTFHNPRCTVMSLEKRVLVYELCKKHGIVILEDNPYGELRFEGKDVPTIKSMDKHGIVVYCGSFSKILSSGMRIGFVSAPSEIIQKMVVAKQVEDVHSNQFFQMLVSDFIEKYDLDAHIAKTREIYKNKAQLMLDTLDKVMPKDVKYTRAQGGLFVWVTLPDYIDIDKYVARCLEKKVAVVVGSAFAPDCCNSKLNSFRITYSTPTSEQIVRGVEILSCVFCEMKNEYFCNN